MTKTLGDICSLQGGFAFKSKDFSNFGVPVIKIANVTGGTAMNYSAMQCVPNEVAAIANRFQSNPGDTLISMTGANVGKITRVWPNEPVALINQRVGRFVPKQPDKFSQDFIHYVVLSHDSYEFFRNAAYGSAQPNISASLIESLPLPDTGLNKPNTIGAIFRSLDDKIELNRKLAATLEEMARALYRSWFVDFDPVHARSQGRPPAHMDHATAALFPDSFGDDGLPEGWLEKSVSEVAEFLNGAALQKFPPLAEEAGIPVIKIAQLRNGLSPDGPRASLALPDKYKIHDGDVLFSWSGSLLQRIWTGGIGALNQHLFKVSSSTVPKWFHFFAVDQHMIEFQAIAASKATTMGHIQRHHLDDAKVNVPTAPVMDAANQLIKPLFDRGFQLQMENQTLATLRDTLLPRLMSGELRVGDARDQIKEVM